MLNKYIFVIMIVVTIPLFSQTINTNDLRKIVNLAYGSSDEPLKKYITGKGFRLVEEIDEYGSHQIEYIQNSTESPLQLIVYLSPGPPYLALECSQTYQYFLYRTLMIEEGYSYKPDTSTDPNMEIYRYYNENWLFSLFLVNEGGKTRYLVSVDKK